MGVVSRIERLFITTLMRLPAGALSRLAGGRRTTADGQTLDPRFAAILAMGDRLSGPLDARSPVEARRELRRFSRAAGGPSPAMREVRDLQAGGVPARLYVPPAAPASGGPVLVFFHGGGDVIGDLATHDPACRIIAEAGGYSVIAIDYRLGPEHPAPACFEDAMAAYRWVVANAASLGAAPDRVAVGGDSMGGRLAAVVSLLARDDPELALPAAQLLIYPGVDACCEYPSERTMAAGFGLTANLIAWFRKHYLGAVPRDDVRISPLHAESHAGLPPAVVVTCGFDPFRDEGRAYADRLEAAGVRVRYRCERTLIHGFVTICAVPEALRALREAAAALAEELGATDGSVAVPAELRPNDALPRTAIIGAGSSGITVAKTFWERGLPFDCFEKSDRVGGMWVYDNSNRLSSAYRSLRINTSRARMEFADLPMPADYPDYPGHEKIAAYFDRFVDHFGFRHQLTMGTGVQRAERDADGVWRLTLDDGTVRRYDALVVASGHHWKPRWPRPAFPGDFDGIQTHSHHYRDPTEPNDLRGKRVVVVGMGNSAMDIASELSNEGGAQKVFLAARRGAWVFPHYLLGRPLDQAVRIPPWVPFGIRRAIGAAIYRAAVGRMEDYGLPRPDHRIGDAHPTISSEILPKLRAGAVTVKPNIAELLGDRVRFTDGSIERVDAIVYCTGYDVVFPFFDESFIAAPENDLPLFRRVFHPTIPNVFFVGLLQPLGAIMPIAEQQGRWIADHLQGRYALPAPEALEADIRRRREKMLARYVASPRHTMQEDFDDYLWELGHERAAGARRAEARGWALPIPPRTRSAEPEPAARPEPALAREA